MNKKINITRTINILLVILWMITVFNFSGEKGDKSSGTSREVTEKVVDVVTNKSDKTKEEKEDIIEKVEPIIRKCAHYTLYLLGGILIINFFGTYNLSCKQKVIYSLIVGMMYATTDEIHQFFVPGRSAKVTDVLIDTAGFLTGIIFFFIIKNVVRIFKGYTRNKNIVVK